MPKPVARPAKTISALNLFELEQAAREKLPAAAFDFFSGGAGDELTLRENRSAFERIKIHPRVLVDVTWRELAATVLGQPITLPVLVAPTPFHKLAHPDGELATVRAAGKMGTVMVLSSLSTILVEDVLKAASGPVWFQLHIYKDRGFTRDLVARVEAAGCQALMLTVGMPEWGRRERSARNKLHLPAGPAAVNLLPPTLRKQTNDQRGTGLDRTFAQMLDASVTWKDVDWLRSLTNLPVVLQGICRADDAARAVAGGVNGIVVSNHGGRQLDTMPAAIDALPQCAEAVGGRIPILLEGGVRRGTDILKAIALGATAVQIGRPVLWGLACGGQAGVEHALTLLRHELDLAMALAGCPGLKAITRDLLAG